MIPAITMEGHSNSILITVQFIHCYQGKKKGNKHGTRTAAAFFFYLRDGRNGNSTDDVNH